MGFLSMAEMDAILAVTDGMGIHRESVTIPLQRKDPGEIRDLGGGQLRFVVPASVAFEEWLQMLRGELEKLGYHSQE